MIPLAMVVRNELDHRASKMMLTQWNHPVETFLLNRSHKSFRVRIRIRGLIRSLRDANSRLLKPCAHDRAPLRIPITDQHATQARIRHRERPDYLPHKRVVRTGRAPKY